MVKLDDIDLSEGCLNSLKKYQQEIDLLTSFHDQVEKAKKIWPARKQNMPFEEVKEALKKMCSGAKRCHYCEDSYADEIEHIHPKNLYPQHTFEWDNYLYACGPCNGPKGDKFKIFVEMDGKKIAKDITPPKRKTGNPPIRRTPPPEGDPLFINPRKEDPFNLIFIDLVDSFMFEPWDEEGTEEYERAMFTIDVLRLNSRDDLVKARENAYRMYKARLKEYISDRNSGVEKEKLDKLIEGIKSEMHPSIWLEMKWDKMIANVPELKKLFEEAPEALDW